MLFNKNLYELKQTGKIWNNLIHTSILKLEFIHYCTDKYIYICYSSENKCILGLYIDDFNITKHSTTIKCFKTEFITKFNIKDLGLMKLLLSIQVS
jgi:Reverse transcriptase (RNA-dependent DNA polymerase)